MFSTFLKRELVTMFISTNKQHIRFQNSLGVLSWFSRG